MEKSKNSTSDENESSALFECNKKHFKYAEQREDGFIGTMLYGGLVIMIRLLILIYLVSFLFINTYYFQKYHAQETKLIKEVHYKYRRNCEEQSVLDAKMFYNECRTYTVDMAKSPSWEAFARLARKQQLCGETGCGSAMYIMVGIVIGCVGLICLLPKLQAFCMRSIDRLNSEPMSSYQTSSSGSFFPNYMDNGGKKWE